MMSDRGLLKDVMPSVFFRSVLFFAVATKYKDQFAFTLKTFPILFPEFEKTRNLKRKFRYINKKTP